MTTARRPRAITILGTRPEIIKCSPLLPRFDAACAHRLIHTGQHYDDALDGRFFRELGLRPPDANLAVGSGERVAQIGRMRERLLPLLRRERPDWVFVQGDTNSTLAGALAAAELGVPIVHLEAGCRSFKLTMPEEVNRVLVDHRAALCLAPDGVAVANLRAEGIVPDRIVMVGSTAVDACLRAAGATRAGEDAAGAARFGLVPGAYLLATIHRAENTAAARLQELLLALGELATTWPVLFPVHPRTAAALDGLICPPGIVRCAPLGYGELLGLVRGARAVLTDSGGLQEEAATLGAPTFVLRDETEWTEFVAAGQQCLAGTTRAGIVAAVLAGLDGGEREARMRAPVGRERAGATDRVLAALGDFAPSFGMGGAAWPLPPPTLPAHSLLHWRELVGE